MTGELVGRLGPGTEDIHRFRLRAEGIEADVLTFGGIIEALRVPDREGRMASVVLGLPTLGQYALVGPYFGALVGRYANRIALGRFALDGRAHRLAANDGGNALHGGEVGFSRRAWGVADAGPSHLTLRRTSPDGEEGYPGALDVTVAYSLAPGALRIDYAAETDRPTVLNLTNHSYFNLAGEGGGSVLGHLLRIEADAFLPTDGGQIPTGELRPVAGTPFDFLTPALIGARIREGDPQLVQALGYDHCWALRGGVTASPRLAARVAHPGSGRVLEVLTTEPGMQFYSGNRLTGSLTGPSGRAYRGGDGFCLETQHFPDSPNRPGFPATALRPGERFTSATVFRFGVE